MKDLDFATVLDHGHVRLIDVMGDDSSVVQAARVSYGSGKKTPEQDEKLIRYLARNRHTSPFEMVEFKFHIKAPLFIARQWVRHRTASWNEISGRYTELKDEFYCPDPRLLRLQSESNRQASVEGSVDDYCADIIRWHSEASYKNYLELIDRGVAREQARMVLPLNIYTEWYWKIDLHNLSHFLRLRMHEHSQYEIMEYAKAIKKLIEPHVPISVDALL